jgi:hypothetical protein
MIENYEIIGNWLWKLIFLEFLYFLKYIKK